MIWNTSSQYYIVAVLCFSLSRNMLGKGRIICASPKCQNNCIQLFNICWFLKKSSGIVLVYTISDSFIKIWQKIISSYHIFSAILENWYIKEWPPFLLKVFSTAKLQPYKVREQFLFSPTMYYIKFVLCCCRCCWKLLLWWLINLVGEFVTLL